MPSEALTLLSFFISAGLLLLFFRYFKKEGVFLFGALAVIAGNIQVLKASPFFGFEEPVALGTVVFSCLYIGSDILTECYGAQDARRYVWGTMAVSGAMALLMLLTLAHPPGKGFEKAHEAMDFLFRPAPGIFFASLAAYGISQLNDIWIFSTLKKRNSFLWFRSFMSTAIGAFIDNLIFSVLAWIVFSPFSLDIKTVLWTYIVGTYGLRLLMAAASIPIIYCAKKII